MRLRPVLALVLTLLVGVGLGWVLAGLGGPLRGPADASLTSVPELSRAALPPCEPQLRGRAIVPPEAASRPASPRQGPVGDAAAEAVVEHVGEEGFEEIVLWEEDLEIDALGERAWLALLTLYAAASRQADFLRAAVKALATGDVDASDVLECVGDAPVKTRAQLLDALRAALPDAGWHVGTVADIYIACDAHDRAVGVLVPAFQESRELDLATRLIRASPDRAAAELQAFLHGDTFDAEALGTLGQAFMGQERGDLATSFFLESLRLEPRNGETLMALAAVDGALAASHAVALTQSSPDDAQAWNWLGKIRADAGDAEAAFEAYQRSAEGTPTTEALYGMLALDPERTLQVARQISTESDNDEVHGAVAKIALQGENLNDALDAVLRAHRTDPTDHEWLRAMVTLDPARALAALEETSASYSGDERDEVIGAKANALGDLGRREDAFQAYLEAHNLDKGDWEWQRGLARADPARALDVLEAYRSESGDEGDLLGAIGDAYAGIGRSDEAMRHYERALEMDGGNEWLAHMARVDPEEATRRIQVAINEKPNEAELWFRLGEAHAAAGHREEATRAFAKARGLDPQNLYYGATWARSR